MKDSDINKNEYLIKVKEGNDVIDVNIGNQVSFWLSVKNAQDFVDSLLDAIAVCEYNRRKGYEKTK